MLPVISLASIYSTDRKQASARHPLYRPYHIMIRTLPVYDRGGRADALRYLLLVLLLHTFDAREESGTCDEMVGIKRLDHIIISSRFKTCNLILNGSQ